jgi:hypothetical protein
MKESTGRGWRKPTFFKPTQKKRKTLCFLPASLPPRASCINIYLDKVLFYQNSFPLEASAGRTVCVIEILAARREV